MLCVSTSLQIVVFSCASGKKRLLLCPSFVFNGPNNCMELPELVELSETQCLFVVMALLVPAAAVRDIFLDLVMFRQ